MTGAGILVVEDDRVVARDIAHQVVPMGRQLDLTFSRRGGKRKGAGRKPKGARAGVEHRRRPRFERRAGCT